MAWQLKEEGNVPKLGWDISKHFKDNWQLGGRKTCGRKAYHSSLQPEGKPLSISRCNTRELDSREGRRDR